ncbi:hypothetical protein ACLH0K_14155 [Arthrobacter sp. MPF02]|uniref:hypothetical protein n=1 Tax=Arthrobacter sp. MPF02 TaxID=3388492 RepID=UPI00398477A2
MNPEHRTALPLASPSGCCCAPAGNAPKPPAAVVSSSQTASYGASSPAPARPGQHSG